MKTYLNRLLGCIPALLILLAIVSAAEPARAVETITYFHNDIAGTPLLATDAAGAVLWKENYRPYGDKLNNPPAGADNKLGYTGKPYDANTGLSYMGARYYDPVIGRFTGIDPIDYDEKNLHSFNRYTYGNNNPYKFKDPDGRSATHVVKITFGVSFAVATRLGAGAVGAWLGDKLWNVLHSEGNGETEKGVKTPEIKPDDLRDKTQGELEQSAKDKGLAQDPKKPNKWRDPKTGEERMRIDPGHVDPKTGEPYDNPRAARPHVHGYDQTGNKIRDPLAGNDPHFPIKPGGTE